MAAENCDLDGRIAGLHAARMALEEPHHYCAFHGWYSTGIWADLLEARAAFRKWGTAPATCCAT